MYNRRMCRDCSLCSSLQCYMLIHLYIIGERYDVLYSPDTIDVTKGLHPGNQVKFVGPAQDVECWYV